MKNDSKFFDAFLDLVMVRLNVMQMCRVVSYDPINKKADVQPQALKSNGQKRSMIQGALVMQHCENTIAVGKPVAVVFSDRDLDNINGSNDFKLSSERMHSVNDAVIVGVWDK